MDLTTSLLAVCEHPSFLLMITIATLIKNDLFLFLLFCLKHVQALQSVFTSNVNKPKTNIFHWMRAQSMWKYFPPKLTLHQSLLSLMHFTSHFSVHASCSRSCRETLPLLKQIDARHWRKSHYKKKIKNNNCIKQSKCVVSVCGILFCSQLVA